MQLLSRHFLTFIPIAKYWAVINILIILPSKTTLFDYFLNTRARLLSWIGNGWTSSVSLTVTCSLQRCFDISEKSGSFDLKRFPTITTYKANRISKQTKKTHTLTHNVCSHVCAQIIFSSSHKSRTPWISDVCENQLWEDEKSLLTLVKLTGVRDMMEENCQKMKKSWRGRKDICMRLMTVNKDSSGTLKYLLLGISLYSSKKLKVCLGFRYIENIFTTLLWCQRVWKLWDQTEIKLF